MNISFEVDWKTWSLGIVISFRHKELGASIGPVLMIISKE